MANSQGFDGLSQNLARVKTLWEAKILQEARTLQMPKYCEKHFTQFILHRLRLHQQCWFSIRSVSSLPEDNDEKVLKKDDEIECRNMCGNHSLNWTRRTRRPLRWAAHLWSPERMVASLLHDSTCRLYIVEDSFVRVSGANLKEVQRVWIQTLESLGPV